VRYAIQVLEERCDEAKTFFFSEQLHMIEHGLLGHLTVFGSKAKLMVYEATDYVTSSHNHTGIKLKDKTVYSDFLQAGYCEIFSWESRSLAADIDHVKFRLRQVQKERSWGTVDLTGFVRRIELRVKKEWAKPGKNPRAYADYANGAIACGEVPEMVKIAIHGSTMYSIGNIRLEVFINAKPTNDNMDYIFTRARRATQIDNYMFVAVYSDDSVYSGNINGFPFLFNVDISSCDTSNNELIFGLVEKLMGVFHEDKAKFLVDMCRLPITTRISCEDMDHFIKILFPHPFEGSGTVLTTILNHIASLIIGVLAAYCAQTMGVSAAIVAGAKLAGHKVTVQDCSIDGAVCFERMQFLKHSMALSESGNWVVYRNFGCFLRSFGSVEGDLTHIQLGISPSQARQLGDRGCWLRFLAGVLKGLKHEPHSQLLDALRDKFMNDNSYGLIGQADEITKHFCLDNVPEI
jgi:hypothetical protein